MKHCILCRKQIPAKPIFKLENAPASAQDIPDKEGKKKDKGMELRLYQCSHCGLVQFDCEPVSYYRDVIRAGGFSTTMTELRRGQYQHLIDTYHLEGRRFLEVGCGRGEFLGVLKEFPVMVYGMEHNQKLAEEARKAGLLVWEEFPERPKQAFGRSGMFAGDIPESFDVFLSFNFLEHQPEPDVMLQAIRNNLSEDGMGLVTVPALEYILEQGSYYELLRDHIAYYSFGTLKNLMERNGFTVLEERIINRDTIEAVVRKNSQWKEGTEEFSEKMVSMDSVTEGYKVTSREVEELLDSLEKEEKSLAVWGASHQGFTLAATTRLGRDDRYQTDSPPFKQGRYAPASHLPIKAPEHFFEEPVDAVLIVAPGYSDEIAGIIRERFGKGVEILTLRTMHLEKL